MKDVIINGVLVVFPILMYLVFSCYNYLCNKKIEKVLFIMTMITSLYLCIAYGYDKLILLFCNIPILMCYYKKNSFLAILMSLLVIIFGYFKYDMNILLEIGKYFIYLISYLLIIDRKDYNYLFVKIIAVIQGIFILFEYFLNVDSIFPLFVDIFIVYLMTFFSLYLFKLVDRVSMMYKTMGKVIEDSKIKDSLFKLTHEIKNPIAVCKGYIDMVDLSNIDKSAKYIGIIKSEIDRSLNVMTDFMEYSKIKINKEEIDLTMLLDDIYESFKILINGKNIKFNYQNKYDEIYIMADYDRLKQVLVNIIKNSIESITHNGIINIDVMLTLSNVIISISDNGIGMDKEELANIKNMFFTTKKNGTGLGVALSNEIILAHNGELTYDSVKLKGTKCSLKLPIK